MPAGTEIRVPASIANLGPGFDTLSVAVGLYLRVRIRHVSTGQHDGLTFEFVDQRLDGTNLIETAFREVAGLDRVRFPSLDVEVRSEIPMRSGLGSSAAATVAGLRLYEAVAGPQPIARLLDTACRVEGHPDNASAALLGGLTSCCQQDTGSVLALTTPWPEALRLVVLTPEAGVDTPAARRVLPSTVTRAEAVFNLQRVALLLQSIHTGDHGYLREALRDRWHQPYRQELVPGLEQALALDHPDLLGICLSGSGPSIVAFAERRLGEIEKLLSDLFSGLGIAHRVRTLAVHQPSPSPRRVEK